MIVYAPQNLDECRVCKASCPERFDKHCHICEMAIWPFLCDDHLNVRLFCENCSQKYIRYFPKARTSEEVVFYFNSEYL